MISELCHFIQSMLQHPPEYKEVCLLHPDFSLLSSLTLQAVMSENRFEVRTTQLSNTKTGMLYEEVRVTSQFPKICLSLFRDYKRIPP